MHACVQVIMDAFNVCWYGSATSGSPSHNSTRPRQATVVTQEPSFPRLIGMAENDILPLVIDRDNNGGLQQLHQNMRNYIICGTPEKRSRGSGAHSSGT